MIYVHRHYMNRPTRSDCVSRTTCLRDVELDELLLAGCWDDGYTRVDIQQPACPHVWKPIGRGRPIRLPGRYG